MLLSQLLSLPASLPASRSSLKRLPCSLCCLLLLALPTVGCGGGGSAPPPDPTGGGAADTVRAQDSRQFSVDTAALPFTALAGAPASDRWWGVLDGAGYRIEVPQAWNGKLVMYAHGYRGTAAALFVDDPSIRRLLLSQGYAWAASSYSANYFDVRAGIESTNALALAVVRIAADNGRTLAAPSHTYIIGDSMGGLVAAAAVDAETLASARNRVAYNGALSNCGVLGDVEVYDYFAATQIAAQQVAGIPVTQWPVSNWAAIEPAVRAALYANYPTEVTPLGERYKAIVKNLGGGERPMFDAGFAGVGIQSVWSTFGRDGTLNGILARNSYDTRGVVYQFDDDPAVSADEAAFNAAAFRLQADPEANPPRADGLRWVPRANARISVPVLTLHTLGDTYIPFSMEQIYRRRAISEGSGDLLVQRAIRASGHCELVIEELEQAFRDLVSWVETGARPAGDEVLDPATVAAPDYGCRFSSPSRQDAVCQAAAIGRRSDGEPG